ncbi:phage portal protein [Glycomyces sp. YM15]|uniref:phage portal protein n=1 Tax=Glycomyces sp. YM15 TaxID=2800446 RepID=UPI001962C25B|nr:phage portal protein [Glycomyces sp. YM15]
MPLPTADQPWPPKALEPVRVKHAEWGAWWSGDAEALASIYGGQASTTLNNHPAQYRGGVQGTLARMWWGQPLPVGEQRTKLHVPLAADIAAKSAELLFAKPPTLTVTGNPEATAWLADRMAGGLAATLMEAGEAKSALGGVFLRICWDRNVAGEAWLDTVDADRAFPEWRWGRLAAVTVPTVLEHDGSTVIRHLERYEPGVILHGLYKGTATRLGRQLPLTAHPVTAGLATGSEREAAVATGTTGLAIAYLPNVRPAPLWRHVPTAAGLGRADIAGSEPLLDAFDETWSSWMRDLRLGKARLMVPHDYLRPGAPGEGATWHADQEVFTPLRMLPSSDGGPQITATQFAIRVEEHSRTARELMHQILRKAGYSPASFGHESEGPAAVTATEFRARQSASLATRAKMTRYVAPPLAQITQALMDVTRAVFGADAAPEPGPVLVDFADAVPNSALEDAQTLQALNIAEATSVRTRVALLHPDWTAEQVDAEAAAVAAERGLGPIGDPGSFTGA